jgi:hypothetical protein
MFARDWLRRIRASISAVTQHPPNRRDLIVDLLPLGR